MSRLCATAVALCVLLIPAVAEADSQDGKFSREKFSTVEGRWWWNNQPIDIVKVGEGVYEGRAPRDIQLTTRFNCLHRKGEVVWRMRSVPPELSEGWGNFEGTHNWINNLNRDCGLRVEGLAKWYAGNNFRRMGLTIPRYWTTWPPLAPTQPLGWRAWVGQYGIKRWKTAKYPPALKSQGNPSGGRGVNLNMVG